MCVQRHIRPETRSMSSRRSQCVTTKGNDERHAPALEFETDVVAAHSLPRLVRRTVTHNLSVCIPQLKSPLERTACTQTSNARRMDMRHCLSDGNPVPFLPHVDADNTSAGVDDCSERRRKDGRNPRTTRKSRLACLLWKGEVSNTILEIRSACARSGLTVIIRLAVHR